MKNKKNKNCIDIIRKFYNRDAKAYKILVEHGRLVGEKSMRAAQRVSHLEPDLEFIREAAMLHDIGIFMIDAPDLGCVGRHPYIAHGRLGRELLEEIGLRRHALVCERHVGVGISAEDIRTHGLPLPERDMLPVSIEERIICYADKFFSKNGRHGTPREKSIEDILATLAPYGEDKVARFQSWTALFDGSCP